MGVTIKKSARVQAEHKPASEDVNDFVLGAVDQIAKGFPKEAPCGTAQVFAPATIQSEQCDYVVAIDCTNQLLPGVENLMWFARELQWYAKRGMIVAFYGQHSMEDVIAAFCMKPKGEDIITDPNHPGVFVAFFKL